MTDIEKRNMERVKLWERTWNTEVDRMVDECYAEDCEVISMLNEKTMRGREALRAIEHAILKFDPKRHMEVTRMVASDDTVAVEADFFWHGNRSKACVFLTFNDRGLVISDHTYAADPTGVTSKPH